MNRVNNKKHIKNSDLYTLCNVRSVSMLHNKNNNPTIQLQVCDFVARALTHLNCGTILPKQSWPMFGAIANRCACRSNYGKAEVFLDKLTLLLAGLCSWRTERARNY